MKSLQKLSLGLLATTLLSGSAFAQVTTLHLIGSTAFRSPATAAIIDYLSQGGATVHAGYSSGSLLGAGQAIIANGTIGGTATIIVETDFTGSLAGVVDLTIGNAADSFFDPTSLTSTQINTINGSAGVVTTSPYGGGTAIGSAATITSAPDVAMSDSVKGTIANELATASPLKAPIVGRNSVTYSSIGQIVTAINSGNIIDGGTNANAGGQGFVGIVPFEWVAGVGATGVSNISQQTARGLITAGYVPQSYLTGTSNAADTANYFYLVGRNEDSGTRIGALAETQFGVTNGPKQFTNDGTGVGLYPVTALNTEPNIVWNTAGHSGYASGGNVATALELATGTTTTFNSNGGKSQENSGKTLFVGYLGVTDANSAVTGGGTALTYNGVPYSVTAVRNGQYTFWAYEHSYHLASISGTTLGNIADGIADNIYLTDADVTSAGAHAEAGSTPANTAAGILDNSNSPVLVYRSTTEGGILSNY